MSSERDRTGNSRSPIVIIVSSVRWSFVWQRHQSLATAAARAGARVLFVDPGLRSLHQVRRVLSSHGGQNHSEQPAPVSGVDVRTFTVRDIVPGHRSSDIRTWCEAVDPCGERERVVLMYLPSAGAERIIAAVQPSRVIYDSVIDWAAAPPEWAAPRGWRRVEARLLSGDAGYPVTVATDNEYTYRTTRTRLLDAAILVNPAPDDVFRTADWGEVPLTGPIGYFGSVRHAEVDVHYLVELARHAQVCVVGPVDSASSSALRNGHVEVMAPLRVDELPAVIRQWRAVVMPYLHTQRSKTMTPAKIWNAVASRRPVYLANAQVPAELLRFVQPLPDPAALASAAPPELPVRTNLPDWAQRWRAMSQAPAMWRGEIVAS